MARSTAITRGSVALRPSGIAQRRGSRLIRMAPRFDDGSLSVHVSAMYYWQDAAQAHRAVEQYDIPGEVVLIVDDDLAATLEV